jgi:hypothetical protein
MGKTRIQSEQLGDDGVCREDLNISIPGRAVVRRIVQGAGIILSSDGVESGTGDVTISIVDKLKKGQAEVDFSRQTTPFGETDVAVATVLADWASVASRIMLSPSGEPTSDHDSEDYAVEGLQATVANIVEGVSFDIVASVRYFTWGKYLINYLAL